MRLTGTGSRTTGPPSYTKVTTNPRVPASLDQRWSTSCIAPLSARLRRTAGSMKLRRATKMNCAPRAGAGVREAAAGHLVVQRRLPPRGLLAGRRRHEEGVQVQAHRRRRGGRSRSASGFSWLSLTPGDGRESGRDSASRTRFGGRQAVARCLQFALKGTQSGDIDPPGPSSPKDRESLCVRPMGGVAMTEKRGRGGPSRGREPHRYGPEGTARPAPSPSSHRRPYVAGLKSRFDMGDAPFPTGRVRCLR